MTRVVMSIMFSSLALAETVSPPEPAVCPTPALLAAPPDRDQLRGLGGHEKHVGGWLLGLGAASVVGGVVMLWDSMDHCFMRSCGERSNEAYGSLFLSLSGPILIATGTVYYILGGSKMARAKKLTLAPSLSPTGGQLQASLRF